MILKPIEKIFIGFTAFLLLSTCAVAMILYMSPEDEAPTSMVAINPMDAHNHQGLGAEESEELLAAGDNNLNQNGSNRNSAISADLSGQNSPLGDNAANSNEAMLNQTSNKAGNAAQGNANDVQSSNIASDQNAALGLFDLEGLAGLKSPQKVSPVRVVEQEVVEVIPFKTIVEETLDLPEGESNIIASGADGERVVLKRLLYDANGLVSEEIISSRITKTKYDRILLKGVAPGAMAMADVEAGPNENERAAMAAAQEAPAAINQAQAQVQEIEQEQNDAQIEEEPPAPVEQEAPKVQAVAQQQGAAANLAFSGSGSADEMVAYNLELLKNAGAFTPAGTLNYSSFSDDGNGTITVNGLNFSYQSADVHFTTCYDGVECSKAMGVDPPINNNTATGVPAQRGLCASNQFPFGTILFVEGYGFCVVSDRHGTSSHPDLVDLCYDGGESAVSGFETGNRKVYVIFTP